MKTFLFGFSEYDRANAGAPKQIIWLVQDALKIWKTTGLLTMYDKVPVKTGNLKSQLKGDSSMAEATLEAPVDYAGYPEYGSSRNQPKPYFRPGLQKANEAFNKKIKEGMNIR